MKKNILSIFTLLAVGAMSLVATSCKDEDSVQDLTLSQVLSATNLTIEANADLTVTVSWRLMMNADSYELTISQDETFADATQVAFTQTIAKEYRKGDYCSVTTPKLDPETKYYARVKACSNLGIADSRYVYADVTTIAEQIMNTIDKADITANSVIISWTAGEVVKEVQVINTDGEVVATKIPTDAEIAAGKMTIDGLSAHTSYTIRLVSTTDKTRGTRTFTTLLDLSSAIVITAAEGADGSWLSTIQNAAAGSVFALEPGDYTSDSNLKINNDVVIAAKDITNMPVLHTQIKIDNNASLYCYYISLTADDATAFKDQCFDFKSTGETGSLDAEGCEISGYAKGLIYINTATVVNEVNITSCFIHDIPCNGGDFIDSRSGSWNTLNFKDNTVVSSFIARDFLRSPKNSNSAGLSNVENNTFYNCGSGNANYRIFYTQIVGAVNNFNSNVVAGFNNKRGFSNNASFGTITASNNVYYDCKNLTELNDGNTESLVFFDETGQVLTATPFKDAENGDYSLTDDNLRLKKVGASRWYEK